MKKRLRMTAAVLAGMLAAGALAGCQNGQPADVSQTESKTVSAVTQGKTDFSDPAVTQEKTDFSDPATLQTIKDNMAHEAAANSGKIELKIWCSAEGREFEKSLVEEFVRRYADSRYTISVKTIVKGEADVGGAVIESPKKAADVFSYADEQLDYLRKADAMAEVLPFYAQNVREENSGDSITAASDNDVLYAFPKTADNGYFMYYDKRVFSEDEVGDMDTMIQKAAAADKNVYLNFGNAYYSTGFFFTAGIEFHFENGMQKDDYDIEQAVSAAKAMCHIAENEGKGFSGNPGQIGDNAYIEQGFQENTLAAAVTGTWMGPKLKELIGADNLGAAKLPTVLMDGEQKQLHSFGGYKMIGVSKFSSFPFSAQTLAYFLTCEENQLKRHTERGAIPTNRRAAASDEVSADPALQAIKAQRPYAHPLGTYAGGVYGASGIASVGGEILKVKGQVSDERIRNYFETYAEKAASGMYLPTL